MIFNSQGPIFQQLAYKICDDILAGKYAVDERIPSVREMAAAFEVNPNTVVKSFDWLTGNEIIYNKRGMGYYVSKSARRRILFFRRKQFQNEYLPEIFKAMNQLNITIKDMEELYNEYNKSQQ